MKPLSRIVHAACMIIVFALAAQAQESTTNPSQIVIKDSLITVVPIRPATEIAADLEQAKNLLSKAETRQMVARNQLSYLDTRIEVKNKEIDLLDKRIDAADEAKKESEVASLKGEKDVAKQLLNILNQQKSVREAEADAAAAQYDYAQAEQAALEMEQQLEKRRAEFNTLASSGEVQQMGVNQMVGELISKTLDAQLDAAKKQQKVSDRRRDLIAQRAKLQELQNNFTAGSK